MVKLKYAPGVTPLINEHRGYTYQSSRIGQTAMSGQKNDRTRKSRQINKQYNLMTAVTNWRNLSTAAKTNWNTFAATYPQPCKNPDNGFLTGYQLFIKRQQYLFLNEGLQSEFLEAPFSEVLTLDNYTFTVDQTENCLDVTENFIKNFGIIPAPGQFLLIKVLPYSVKSGQFFPVVTQTIEILESYVDGLFVSLHLPVNCRDIVFSVYLSKPVNQSVVYSGTKTRYMGCFTTKTFLGLTDTPDTYTGQAGKIVSVNDTETGLVFSEMSGGSDPATITSETENVTLNDFHSHMLNPTGVVAGTYSPVAITVDSKGRITAASQVSLPTGTWSAVSETIYTNNNVMGSIGMANAIRTYMFQLYIYQGTTKIGNYMSIVDYRTDGSSNLVETKVIFNDLPISIVIYFDYNTAIYPKVAFHLNNGYGSTIYIRRCWQTIWQQ